MSFDRPCEVCKRSRRIGGVPIEVCFSDRLGVFACMSCHFDAPLPQPSTPAILAGGDKEIYWRTMVKQ